MENSENKFQEILYKLQESLNEFKCKSEIRISEKEAILYGKFSLDGEKQTVIVHLKEEGYTPVKSDANRVEARLANEKKSVIPSLEFQHHTSPLSSSNSDEQISIKNAFIAEANEIGKEFLKKIKK